MQYIYTYIYTAIFEHWMKNRICTKLVLCKPVANIDFAKVCTHCKIDSCQICKKCANLATTTFAMGANLCKVDICNRFAQDKLCANSIFHPVESINSIQNNRIKTTVYSKPPGGHLYLNI